MAEAKFTILGTSGSGKTCFLLGLYQQLRKGFNKFTLVPDEDTAYELDLRVERMLDMSQKDKRLPAGTTDISKYCFQLQYGYKKVIDFDWIDYRGGALRDKKSGNTDEYNQIKQTIIDSNGIFICVDGELLIEDNFDIKIENVQNKCSSIINFFISEFDKNNKFLPPIAIVVTKYDICREYTNEEELWEIMHKAFGSLFVKPTNENNERIISVIPVSLGKDFQEEDFSGKLVPLNIHLPIFMGIWFELRDYRGFLDYESGDVKEKYQEQIDTLNRKIAEEKDSWFFVDDKAISNWESQIDKLVDEGNDKINFLNEENKKMGEYMDILQNELEGMLVFSNGEIYHF